MPGKPKLIDLHEDNAELFISYSQVGDETILGTIRLQDILEWYLTNVIIVSYVSPFKTITSCCRSSVIKITWEMWEVLKRFTETCFSTLRVFLTYLGYRVSKESISPMDDKLDAITNKPPPKECVIAKVASEIFYEIWVRFFKRAASATHCQIVE